MNERMTSEDLKPAGKSSVLARPMLLCLLLVAATLAVYWPVIHYDFLTYDDPDYFTHNGHVLGGLTPNNVVWAFTTGHASNWHPLTWLSLMLDVELFGKGPAWPHLTNLLFHLANTVLLFLLLRQMTAALWRSAMVAALFALHPLHVESVVWVAERKDVLSTFFGLLSLWFYAGYARHVAGDTWPAFAALRRGEQVTGTETAPASILSRITCHVSRYYWLALAFFACGLMSKPMLVTLPFVMLLLDYWPLGRVTGTKPGSTFVRLVFEKWPFFVLSAISGVVTFWMQKHGGAVAALAKYSFPARVENAFVSYARYLAKTFWPVQLATPYPYVEHWPWAWILSATVLFAGLGIAALWLGRRFPFVFTGWFWFVGTLIPVIGLVQVGDQAMADRYTYVPLIGLFIILAWGGWEAWCRWRLPGVFVVPAAALLLAAAAGQTRCQAGFWRDTATLFRHMLAITHNNYTAYVNLGNCLSVQGDTLGAIQCFREAQQMNPSDPTVLYNLGNGFADLSLWDEAIAAYRKALDIAPNQADTLNNLGLALTAKKQLADAARCFESALKVDPDSASAHNNLATILYREHQFDGAVVHFREAVRLAPDDPQIQANLGDALVKLGQTAEAVRCYQEALRLKPDSPQIRAKLQALGVPASN